MPELLVHLVPLVLLLLRRSKRLSVLEVRKDWKPPQLVWEQAVLPV